MKKLYSLIRACMTTDMQVFKIKTKKKNKFFRILIPLIIGLYLMFYIGVSVGMLFEKMAPLHLQTFFLAFIILGISIFTVMEGVYKAGPLIFNCKDDQLLLSLPIKRRTVLFVRIFKFYVFELIFNSLFLVPVIIAYIKYAEVMNWTFFLTSFFMILLIPIIPIIISCFIGALTINFSSKFKHKSLIQIIVSMTFVLIVLYISMNINNIINYLTENASSINEVITKIYYPAGAYAKLVTNFNVFDLLMFIGINVGLFVLSIFILSKFYFKINSKIKNVKTNNSKIKDIVIKSRSKYISLVRKELNTFFKNSVFVINAGFSLVLFLIVVIAVTIKYEDFLAMYTKGLEISPDFVTNNISIIILMLLIVSSFMASITNSVISLEGRNINILKSLPVKAKDILIGKILFALVITTPVFIVGNIILFIRLKVGIIEALLLLIISILLPLISHFIGLIINLKYPKLDAENATEIVKQSMSSFLSVMIGMIFVVINIIFVIKFMGAINPIILLLICISIYIIIDILLYLYLTKRSIKDFNKLSI